MSKSAARFDWLVLSIPINRAMFDARRRFSDDERDRCAEEAVGMFLAAHQTPRFNGRSIESIFGARTPRPGERRSPRPSSPRPILGPDPGCRWRR